MFTKKISLLAILIITFLSPKVVHSTSLNKMFIEDIPIHSSIIIDKSNTVEFDSTDGKLIVVPFTIKTENIIKMKNFYNNYFDKNDWIKKKIKYEFEWEKKISTSTKKVFFLKKKSNQVWTLNFVVVNF